MVLVYIETSQSFFFLIKLAVFPASGSARFGTSFAVCRPQIGSRATV